MNENSKLPTPPSLTAESWLSDATQTLRAAGIDSARLDAELLLAHTIRKPRTWLHAHGDETLSDRHQEIFAARLRLRLDRVPVAYIIGHKDFYGRRFSVSPAVLVPRPESEVLIELLKRYAKPRHTSLVDIGTGSGCLGITAKLELPHLRVTLCDISPHTLKVAASNAARLSAEVMKIKSDLLREYPASPDIIIANLPYVDESWERSPETNHEPALALFSAHNGLAHIRRLLEQAASRLTASGLLILEADPYQHPTIIEAATAFGFMHLESEDYGLAFQKRSVASAR